MNINKYTSIHLIISNELHSHLKKKLKNYTYTQSSARERVGVIQLVVQAVPRIFMS